MGVCADGHQYRLVDAAPTIAAMLRVPVPRHSAGTYIMPVFDAEATLAEDAASEGHALRTWQWKDLYQQRHANPHPHPHPRPHPHPHPRPRPHPHPNQARGDQGLPLAPVGGGPDPNPNPKPYPHPNPHPHPHPNPTLSHPEVAAEASLTSLDGERATRDNVAKENDP